jgi:protein-S-isoprenylcysteine O-methyltransferase Ste14
MDTSVSLPVLLCLLALSLVAALPRVFFRPGRLNGRWWLTAAPFAGAGAVLLAGAVGLIEPAFPAGSPAADVLGGFSGGLVLAAVGLLGFTIGSHRDPVRLWHQDDPTPERLVTHGAYARVRHPFYAAFLLVLLACVAAFPHAGTAIALLAGGFRLNRTAALEERWLLSSRFAPEYRDYLDRTGRFLPLPGRR